MEPNKILPLLNADLNMSEGPKPSANNFNMERHSLDNLLHTLYPENRAEDKELLKVKQILGEKEKEFTSEQIKDLMTKVQYLVQSWLDEYERQIFKGQTLHELLSSKQL
ncbi:MAG: hypothetical protein RI947_585 [Candidatus Parcubacteria bacterium]|jgi:hypothetical protein